MMFVVEYVCFWCGSDLAICTCADCGVVPRQTVAVVVDDGADCGRIGSVDRRSFMRSCDERTSDGLE